MKTKSDQNVIFGKRLKTFRIQHGRSVTEVAEAVGVAPTTYREWEMGRAITGQPYVRLAQFLKISIHELFGVENQNHEEVLKRLREIEKLLGEMTLFL